MSKRLGQPVFALNKPGPAGNVAMGEVARADDQHTILPALQAASTSPQYDPLPGTAESRTYDGCVMHDSLACPTR